MSNAKKAAKPASILDDEDALVDKIAHDIEPAAPGGSVEKTDLGLTAVADRSVLAAAQEGGTVRMVHADGEEADVDAAQVRIHERSGWKRVKEDEA